MGIGDYIQAKDESESRYDDDRSLMQVYLDSKDAEDEVDDRSLMQIYLDSKDSE